MLTGNLEFLEIHNQSAWFNLCRNEPSESIANAVCLMGIICAVSGTTLKGVGTQRNWLDREMMSLHITKHVPLDSTVAFARVERR